MMTAKTVIETNGDHLLAMINYCLQQAEDSCIEVLDCDLQQQIEYMKEFASDLQAQMQAKASNEVVVATLSKKQK